MTEQTIPADKVRELAELARQHNSESNPYLQENLANEICNRLQAYLPDPPQPTSGLLGRWAKHPEHGDVVCGWDRPDVDGSMLVRWPDEKAPRATNWVYAPLDSLTFPEQATKPEDVSAGEAWLVNLAGGKHTRVVALKASHDTWRIGRSDSIVTLWRDEFVELIAPLTPERPGKDDLQAKYDELEKSWKHLDDLYSERGRYLDELEDKYREAQERIKALEQPVWRIEHDPDNLRVGEYIIDCEDGDGTVTHEWRGRWDTDGEALGASCFAPFIVFPSKDEATPEAIEEAKKARDKEINND